MTDSQSDSVGTLSPCATVGDSAGGLPLSRRLVIAGGTAPENARVCVGPSGGQVVPLLSMAQPIGTK
jgi:hypothetical protein